MTLLRTHGVTVFITAVVWAVAAIWLGVDAFATLAVLTLLEITFSFDNAALNAKLVGQLSLFWQRLFMTAGMLIAVGAVRFALPVLIVAATAGLGIPAVTQLVLHDAAEYGLHLHEAAPLIAGFGGPFLIMIGVAFFLNGAKEHHWLRGVEKRLAPLGRYDNTGILIMLGLAVVLYFTVDGTAQARAGVLAAAICGITLHVALDLLGAVLGSSGTAGQAAKLTGGAAAVMFARLEILDASFSFDGVIGAFAITTSVILIGAGLGLGALWVRSLTVHLVRAGTLDKYQYLEHGAHWAILALGAIMVASLYGVHLPEAVTGSIGLVFIAAAVASSMAEKRKAPVT